MYGCTTKKTSCEPFGKIKAIICLLLALRREIFINIDNPIGHVRYEWFQQQSNKVTRMEVQAKVPQILVMQIIEKIATIVIIAVFCQ